MKEFLIGERVRSKRIGGVPEFDGVVESKRHAAYQVRDGAGRLWHRNRNDLKAIRSVSRASHSNGLDHADTERTASNQ